jgi:hypothetical protein
MQALGVDGRLHRPRNSRIGAWRRSKRTNLLSPAWITRIGEFLRRGVAASRSLEHWRDETSQCSGLALAERGEASSRFADCRDGKGGPSISGGD